MSHPSLIESLEQRVLFARVEGVDVSVFQGAINWNTLYANDKEFAFVRASRTNLALDPNFTTNMTNAKAAGVLVGAYHRALPKGESEQGVYTDPVTDANRFYTAAGAYMTAGNLRPVLDIEDGYTLGKEALSQWVIDFCNEVERLSGVEPIVYANANYATNYLNTAVASDFDLWIARWNGNNANNVDPQTDQPETPAGWANPYGSWNQPLGGAPSHGSWDFWQYTSNGDGIALGVSSARLDLDVFNGNMDQLKQGFLIGHQWNYPSGTPFAVGPGITTAIQAEHSDNGGQGVAYNDTTPTTNTGGAFRTGEKHGVDLKLIGGTTNQYRIGDSFAGEWVEYTVNVAQAGSYKLDLRLSQSDPNAKIHVKVDGANVTGSITVPDTNSFSTFTTVSKTINLSAGKHVLRLAFDQAARNGTVAGVDWIRIAQAQPSTTKTITTSTAAYVRGGGSAGTNFGSASELIAKRSSTASHNRQAYLKFDLSSVASIGTAKLRLYGRVNETGSVGVRVLSASNTSWTESGLTWNSKPAPGSTVRGGFTVSGTTSKWYEVDLTTFLKNEKAAGRNLVTLVLDGAANTNPYATFASDETANSPRLVVTT